MCAGLYELKLARYDDSRQEPILFDARLISMHGSKMLFREIERGPDGAECAQEWSVLVTARWKV